MKSLGKGVVTWSYEQYRSNAKKEYDEFWKALFRELIQNANDAGSSQIHISLDQPVITVQDDGCGMDLDTIQDKLLVIGGSFKDGKAVGGLGKAKELLFFSQPKWIIATNEHCIKGVGGEFEIFKLDIPIKGTTVTLYQPDKVCFSDVGEAARFVIDRCQVKPRISINSVTYYPQMTKGKMIRDIKEIGHLYYTKTCLGKKIKDNYHVHVRVNGCWMFDKWVGQHDGRIILDIDSDRLPPIDGLTANRDALKFKYGQTLDALVQEISKDKKSALTKREPVINLLKGSGQVYTSPSSKEIDDMADRMNAIDRAGDGNDLNALAGLFGQDAINAERLIALFKQSNDDWKSVAGRYSHIINYEPDFIIYEDPENSDWSATRIQKFMKTQKAATIAKVWTEMVKQVCLDNNVKIRFTAGFIFDRTAEAMRLYQDNVEHYLINPLFVPPTGVQNKVPFVNYMRTTAVHEVTHQFQKWHDEDFTSKYHKLEAATWDSHRIYSRIGTLR